MSSETKAWIGGTVAAAIVVVALWWWMIPGYDKVSPKGYQYAMALISICNRQDAERLDTLIDQIAASKRDGNLPLYDARILLDITDRASAGSWQSASKAIRRLMEDQVDQ